MNDEDPLAPAKGVIFSVLSALVLWALVLGWLWLT